MNKKYIAVGSHKCELKNGTCYKCVYPWTGFFDTAYRLYFVNNITTASVNNIFLPFSALNSPFFSTNPDISIEMKHRLKVGDV